MVHGLPDWGLRGPKSTTYGLDDLGEAVARLGSPVVWDRRGDVVAIESFEGSGGSYDTHAWGVGAAVHRTCAGAHTGAYGYALTAGSNGLCAASVFILSPALVLGPCGLEIWFGLNPNTEYIAIDFVYYTGTEVIDALLRYSHALSTVSVYAEGPVWHEFAAGITLPNWGVPKHVIKLVANFDTRRYVRAIVNEVTYDLHTIPMYVAGDPTDSQVIGNVIHGAVPLTNPEIIVDDLILTQNEPVSL